MGMTLLISPDVFKQIASMPEGGRTRVLDALRIVAANLSTRQPFVTEMVGEPGVWRLRKEDWRAVYRVVEGDVVVDAIAHRREVYR